MSWFVAKRTKATPGEAREALRRAFTEVLHREPSAETLGVAMALAALETSNFQSMWLWNFGNVKVSARVPLEQQNYQNLPFISEILSDGREHFYNEVAEVVSRLDRTPIGTVYTQPPGHPQNRFRAYSSLDEGARAWVRFIAESLRYQVAWSELLAGDLEGFGMALHEAGYYTASPSVYLPVLRERFRLFYIPGEEGDSSMTTTTKVLTSGALRPGSYSFTAKADPSGWLIQEVLPGDQTFVVTPPGNPEQGWTVDFTLEQNWEPSAGFWSRAQAVQTPDGGNAGGGALGVLVGGLAALGGLLLLRKRKG